MTYTTFPSTTTTNGIPQNSIPGPTNQPFGSTPGTGYNATQPYGTVGAPGVINGQFPTGQFQNGQFQNGQYQNGQYLPFYATPWNGIYGQPVNAIPFATAIPLAPHGYNPSSINATNYSAIYHQSGFNTPYTTGNVTSIPFGSYSTFGGYPTWNWFNGQYPTGHVPFFAQPITGNFYGRTAYSPIGGFNGLPIGTIPFNTTLNFGGTIPSWQHGQSYNTYSPINNWYGASTTPFNFTVPFTAGLNTPFGTSGWNNPFHGFNSPVNSFTNLFYGLQNFPSSYVGQPWSYGSQVPFYGQPINTFGTNSWNYGTPAGATPWSQPFGSFEQPIGFVPSYVQPGTFNGVNGFQPAYGPAFVNAISGTQNGVPFFGGTSIPGPTTGQPGTFVQNAGECCGIRQAA